MTYVVSEHMRHCQLVQQLKEQWPDIKRMALCRDKAKALLGTEQKKLDVANKVGPCPPLQP